MASWALIFYAIAGFACSFAVAHLLERLLLSLGRVEESSKTPLESGPIVESIQAVGGAQVLQFPSKLRKRNIVDERPQVAISGDFDVTGTRTDAQATN